MTAANLINLAEKAGILLTLEAGQLVADAPEGALTVELLEDLRRHKAELIARLSIQATKPDPEKNPVPNWQLAFHAYLNHIMACNRCWAPKSRYCPEGLALRDEYNRFFLESQEPTP